MAEIKYRADDWFIIVGLFFTLGVVITSLLGIRYGAGRHVILVKDPAGFAKLLISAEVIWGFAITAVKVSILSLYHRIFSFNNRTFTIMVWTVGVFVVCYCTIQSFAAIFNCHPIQSNWNPYIKHHCGSVLVGSTTISALNVLIDFIILVMPMPILYSLHRPLGEKVSLMGIFLLGGLVCFASLYRCIVVHQISYTDPTYSDVRVDIWTIVELCIGILSACLPTMRPLFNRRKLASKFSLGSGPGRSQEKSSKRMRSEQGLTRFQSNQLPTIPDTPDTPDTPTFPSQSKEFAHIGVLQTNEEKPEEHV